MSQKHNYLYVLVNNLDYQSYMVGWWLIAVRWLVHIRYIWQIIHTTKTECNISAWIETLLLNEIRRKISTPKEAVIWASRVGSTLSGINLARGTHCTYQHRFIYGHARLSKNKFFCAIKILLLRILSRNINKNYIKNHLHCVILDFQLYLCRDYMFLLFGFPC